MLLLARAGVAAPSAAEVATNLDALEPAIAAKLTAELQRTNLSGSYTVVWRAYEDAVIGALEKVLSQHLPELTAKNFDVGKTGREKKPARRFCHRLRHKRR